MEDMMKALLDVVRAQHTATEGSEERPFDINDIIDMALNITGRPEEPEEQQELLIRFRAGRISGTRYFPTEDI